jgi:hypothetical protein
MEVGSFLESNDRYDLAYHVQKEVDLLIMPAIERLKDKSRERDRATAAYLEEKRRQQLEAELAELDNADDD